MWKVLRRKDVGVRILLGVILGLISVGMLVYLIPGQGDSTVSGDRKSTRLNSSHIQKSRMPSSA